MGRPYKLRFQTLKLWQHREEPPPFRVALGSCAFVNEAPYDRPGRGYGNDYEIFMSINDRRPDIMLWLGDNTYLREPDWNTRTGVLNRYTHTRSLPQMQPLLAASHNYAIWDDHDFAGRHLQRHALQCLCAIGVYFRDGIDREHRASSPAISLKMHPASAGRDGRWTRAGYRTACPG